MEDVRQTTEVVVKAVKAEATGVMSLELARPDGGELPPFTAGAHIDLHLRDDVVRQYSLCNDPTDRDRYVIAVLREPNGRGGSRAMHDLKPGDAVRISAPKNHFPLAGPEATSHLLLAGGIGITPMMAMIAELERRNVTFRLHYCARAEENAAFLESLGRHVDAGRAVVHFDGGDPSKGLDIAALLSEYSIGTHLYFCGPPGFMSAVKAATTAWPAHTVHFEHFSTPLDMPVIERSTFSIRLAQTGDTFAVPADKTMAGVLEENGISVTTDCREGYCGTCITRFTSGQPEHYDTVLSEKERENFLMLCCARAKEGSLVTIDL